MPLPAFLLAAAANPHVQAGALALGSAGLGRIMRPDRLSQEAAARLQGTREINRVYEDVARQQRDAEEMVAAAGGGASAMIGARDRIGRSGMEAVANQSGLVTDNILRGAAYDNAGQMADAGAFNQGIYTTGNAIIESLLTPDGTETTTPTTPVAATALSPSVPTTAEMGAAMAPAPLTLMPRYGTPAPAAVTTPNLPATGPLPVGRPETTLLPYETMVAAQAGLMGPGTTEARTPAALSRLRPAPTQILGGGVDDISGRMFDRLNQRF